MTTIRRIFSLFVILLIPVTFYSNPVPPQSAADVNVSGAVAPDKVKKGPRVTRASVMSGHSRRAARAVKQATRQVSGRDEARRGNAVGHAGWSNFLSAPGDAEAEVFKRHGGGLRRTRQ